MSSAAFPQFNNLLEGQYQDFIGNKVADSKKVAKIEKQTGEQRRLEVIALFNEITLKVDSLLSTLRSGHISELAAKVVITRIDTLISFLTSDMSYIDILDLGTLTESFKDVLDEFESRFKDPLMLPASRIKQVVATMTLDTAIQRLHGISEGHMDDPDLQPSSSSTKSTDTSTQAVTQTPYYAPTIEQLGSHTHEDKAVLPASASVGMIEKAEEDADGTHSIYTQSAAAAASIKKKNPFDDGSSSISTTV